MATEIQGIDFKVQVREAGDTDWKRFVCEIDSQFQHSNDTQETDTKCGTFNGIKNLKGNYSGNAVFNVDPDADEVSYNQVLTWQKAKTRLEFLIENEAYTAEDGTSIAEAAVLHIFASGRFVDSTLQGAVGDIGKFSWQFKPTGEPTISGSSS
jgi:hypothetical protein